MAEKRCRVKLVPDDVKGWKLMVEGCETELERINASLGKHGRRYFRKRVTLIEEVEAEEAPAVEEEQASEEPEAEEKAEGE